jgi:hypothetical protein
MASKIARALAAAAGATVLIASALPGAATAAFGPDACLGAVKAIGAQMGRGEPVQERGAPALRYVVRTNGCDYDVICDPATGLVSDVSPRGAPAPESN